MSQSHAGILSECYFVPTKDIEVLNICDPYGGNEFIYRECRDQIYNSVKEIIESLDGMKNYYKKMLESLYAVIKTNRVIDNTGY